MSAKDDADRLKAQIAQLNSFDYAAPRIDDAPFREQRRQARNMSDAAEASLKQASKAVQDILAELNWFEQSIDPAEEARIVVVGGPAGTAIFLLSIKPMGHDRILFSGTDQEGCRVTVMQHVSQLNLMLKAVKVGKEKARRIGFHSPNGNDA